MDTRNISNQYLKNFTEVLNRYEIPYKLAERKDEEYSQITTNLTSQDFDRYVERAMCEFESETMHNGRFVISYNELLNYKDALQKEFFPDKRGMVYHILTRDKDKLDALVGEEISDDKCNNINLYAVGDITLDGIDSTEAYKEYVEKVKNGTLTKEDIKRYLSQPYKMRE